MATPRTPIPRPPLRKNSVASSKGGDDQDIDGVHDDDRHRKTTRSRSGSEVRFSWPVDYDDEQAAKESGKDGQPSGKLPPKSSQRDKTPGSAASQAPSGGGKASTVTVGSSLGSFSSSYHHRTHESGPSSFNIILRGAE